MDYLFKDNYDQWLSEVLSSAVEISHISQLDRTQGHEFLLRYPLPKANDPAVALIELTNIMKNLNLMEDHKAGVPRTSYKYVIPFRRRTQENYFKRIWLVPDHLDLKSLELKN